MLQAKEIFREIEREQEYQNKVWGPAHGHEVGGWLTILRVLLTEAEQDWAKTEGDDSALQRIVEIAAVATSCLQQFGTVTREEARSSRPCKVFVEMGYPDYTPGDQNSPSRIEVLRFRTKDDAETVVSHLQDYVRNRHPDKVKLFHIYTEAEGVLGSFDVGREMIDAMISAEDEKGDAS